MNRYVSVAIDGPAGAGKSTLARRAAEELGYLYIDTGAMYRTVALHMLRAGADPGKPEEIVSRLAGVRISCGRGPGGEQRMFLDGEDVTDAIRENAVSEQASRISAIPEVRAFLLEYQRQLAREQNSIMDGRDIGTVVLPHADLKVFLTAAPEARARRRVKDLEQRGQKADFGTVLEEIRQRDLRDATRSAAPMVQAEDAVLLDTTDMTIQESLQALLELIKGVDAP